MHRAMCWGCGQRTPMADVLDRVRVGEADPACRACGGILKSDTISFGQALVPAVIDRAMLAAAQADLLLAVGSSLQVYPVAGVVPVARQAGARIVIINNQPTPTAWTRQSDPMLCCGLKRADGFALEHHKLAGSR